MEIKDIILKSFSQELSAAEQTELKLWLEMNDYNRESYIKLRKIYSLSKMVDKNPSDEEKLVINQVGDKIRLRTETTRNYGKLLRYAAVAAVVTAVIGISLYGIFNFRNRDKVVMAQSEKNKSQIKNVKYSAVLVSDNATISLDKDTKNVVVDGVEVDNDASSERVSFKKLTPSEKNIIKNLNMIVPRGCTYSAYLPDSTLVWLNAESKISFPSSFTGDSREVTLKGEAFFVVAHDKNKPFRVHFKDGGEVKVLGTQFSLRCYGDERGSSVVLSKGSVEVMSKKESITITPMQKVTIDDNYKLTKSVVEDDNHLSWIRGQFNYKDMLFSDIASDLSRRFDVKIKITDDALAAIRLTLQLSKGTTINDIINALNRAGKHIFTLKMSDGVVSVIKVAP